MKFSNWNIGLASAVICFCFISTATGQSWSSPQPPMVSSVPLSNAYFSSAYGSYNVYGGNYQQQMVWDNQVLQAELELTRDQRRALLDVKLDYDERVGHHRLKMQKAQAKVYRLVNGKHELDEEGQKRLAELQKEYMQMREDANAQIDEVLLPHQRELKVRLAGERVMSQGFVRFISNGSIQKQLKMDNETKTRIAKKKKELEARLQSEMAELVRKAHDELLAELDGDARDMAEKMLDQYEYSEKANGIALLQYDRYFMKKRKKKDED